MLLHQILFDDWLIEQFGFYRTGKYLNGINTIVITNQNKKLLFDLKYQHEL